MTSIEANPNRSPLLKLPSKVRLQIYAAANILGPHDTRRFIHLYHGGAPNPIVCSSKGRVRFLVTHALLLSCRTIYEEVSALVYGSQHFFLRYNATSKFEALKRLRPASIQALRQLTLHLTVASCGLGNVCDRRLDPWHTSDYDRLDEPLRMPEPAAQDVLSHWHRVWYDHIRPSLTTPYKLELNIICDVADFETAKLVVQPFLDEKLPCIAECSVRLSKYRDLALLELAERAVQAIVPPMINDLTKTPQPCMRRFRFLDLPPELRQHVLQYTDLVTPRAEVEWNLTHGFYHRTGAWGHNNVYPNIVHGSPSCTYNDPYSPRLDPHASDRGHYRGCFCASLHSAYSSHRSCKCWAPPTPLFLVCQTVRQDALHVFYRHNRFIVAPTGGGMCGYFPPVAASPFRLPASIFLTEVVPTDALRHLRFLELVFPSFGIDRPCKYCPEGSLEQHDWIETLDRVKDELNLPQLTISVHFTHWLELNLPCSPFRPPYREFMSQRQVQADKECYISTLAPLKVLRRAKRFFAHLANPRGPIERNYRCYLEDWEREIETIVMGPTYDSILAGKADVAKSLYDGDHRDEEYGWM